MLLRGCHRRTICIKSADSRLFDEAFFVLREDGRAASEADMLTEAERILKENLLPRGRRAPARSGGAPRWRLALAFCLGLTVAWISMLVATWIGLL